MLSRIKEFFSKIGDSSKDKKLDPNYKLNYIKKNKLKELTSFYFNNDSYYLTTSGLIVKTNLYGNTFTQDCSKQEIIDIQKWNPSIFKFY